MSHVLVKDGKVVNVVLWEPQMSEMLWAPQGAAIYAYAGPAGIGWDWDGAKAIDPRPPTPSQSAEPPPRPADGGPTDVS